MSDDIKDTEPLKERKTLASLIVSMSYLDIPVTLKLMQQEAEEWHAIRFTGDRIPTLEIGELTSMSAYRNPIISFFETVAVHYRYLEKWDVISLITECKNDIMKGSPLCEQKFYKILEKLYHQSELLYNLKVPTFLKEECATVTLYPPPALPEPTPSWVLYHELKTIGLYVKAITDCIARIPVNGFEGNELTAILDHGKAMLSISKSSFKKEVFNIEDIVGASAELATQTGCPTALARTRFKNWAHGIAVAFDTAIRTVYDIVPEIIYGRYRDQDGNCTLIRSKKPKIVITNHHETEDYSDIPFHSAGSESTPKTHE
jgi:hypothetical protein